MSRSFANASRVSSALAIALVVIAMFVVWTGVASADPLTGILNIPGDYATLADAITALNTDGVGTNGVTLNLVAGNPETAPAGGYVVGGAGSLVLTTSSSGNPVTIQGNGNTITASPALTAGVLYDAIFNLIGADWITLTGFVMQENPANTTTTPASNNMTEWGVALLHVSTTDGSQNNTIQGNTISLNRSYTNTWGVYANNRHSATAPTTTEDVTNNTTGPQNGNRVYGNAIGNVNMGIALIGTSAAANQDVGNDVGGGSSLTGNTLTNWGGAAAASSYVSNSGTSYCIFMNHQTADNTAYNVLTSAAVSGTSVTFRGIFKDYTAGAPAGTFASAITNNTVTMTSGFTSGTFEAIRSQGMTSLATATININANTILNCAVTGVASSSAIVGIVNSSVPGTLSMSNNIVQGSTSTATSGGFTGVQNAGAVVTAINLNNNQIGNASGGAITFSAATSGTVYGIYNSGGAATAALSIQGNDIRGITHSVAGTSAQNYIYNSAATLSQNISSNTYTNLLVNTSGTVYFIYNSVTAPTGGSKTVNNNSIVTAFSKTGGGGTVYGYYDNGSSVAGVVENNNNNNYSNITVTGATTLYGWYNTDGGSPTKTAQGNVFSNWAGGTSGITGMYLNYGPSFTVTQNTISSIAGAGAVTGIVLNSSLTLANVSQNTINTLSSTGASAVQGITSATATSNIFKNRIYDLSGSNATTTVNGMLVSSGTTITATNNLIGDLRATAATATTDAIRGISITSATSSSAINLYDNTIYLNATSSGANFSTAGVYHTTSATATTAALNMRGNVLVNLSTPNGTGMTAAYRRSSTTLTNYASTSNSNLFYGGVPAANRLIFYDGTNADQTLAAYQARVTPRDANSVTESPTFLSTVGSSPNFLHIDPTIPTQIESGGQPIAGVTDDYDGQARNATTPDIGADEGDFPLADFAPPVIAYTPLGGTTSTSNRSFTNVVVTDPSGVNGTAGTRPRVYYKKSGDANAFNDNTSGTAGWKYAEANGATSAFDFTIDYSLLNSGVPVVGDVIQYFVVAQDLATTPNVGINSGTFATQPTSVNLQPANFPIGGTIRSYTIVDVPLSGDYTVGTALFARASGVSLTFERRVRTVTREVLEPEDAVPQMSGDKSSSEVTLPDQLSWKRVLREVEEVTWVPMADGHEFLGDLYVKRSENADLLPEARAGVYATITAAVADLNLRGVSGPVRFLLTDATYPSETFPITVNVTSESLPTATNTVTIKPDSSVTASVSGASASTAIFKIFNTSYVTIDGSNAPDGTTRDLTLQNTSTTGPLVVWFGSSGTTPITNDALKNCIVRNGVNTNSAVMISDGTTAGNAGYFSSLEVRNNRIDLAYIGVYANGGTTPAGGANLTYADNRLDTSGANAIRLVGLYMQGVNGATVSDNTVANLEGATAENDIGIWLASGTYNATVSGNTVTNLNYTGTSAYAPIGIDVTSGVVGANIDVARNSVTALATSGSSPARGIGSLTSTTTGVIIERNNVSGVTNNSTSTFGAYGIDVTAGNNHTIKNNFVSDVRFNMSGGAAFSTTFGIFGIRIGAGSGHVVANNSVNLFGPMLGTPASSLLSAALCVVSTGSTGCDIRDNALSNTITGGTTSIAHVSAYLPLGGTSTMNLTWNNNAYYSGTDALTQGIAQVGTTAGTGFYLAGNFNPGATTPATNLRAYTSTLSTAGTNDNASFATTGTAPFTTNTDLHVLTNVPTPLESGGAPIAGILNDYDGEGRNPTTPDIGADEGPFTPLFSNDIRAVAFIDPTSGGTKSAGVPFAPQASFENVGTANQTNVQVKYWITGPSPSPAVVYADSVVIAVMNANSGPQVITFASATLSGGVYAINARSQLAGDQVPSNDQITGSLTALEPMSGTYLVGISAFQEGTGVSLTFEPRIQRVTTVVLEPADLAPKAAGQSLPDRMSWKEVTREIDQVTWVPFSNGREFTGRLAVDHPQDMRPGAYATITAAVADLNARGLSGPVEFLLTDATYPSETLPIVVHVTSGAPTPTNTFTIKPNVGVTSTVAGASASGPIFKVLATNYVTIDGSNSVGGTTRDLTLENTSTTTPSVVWFGSSGTTPITNGTLENCVVRNGAISSSAVVISDGTTSGSAGYFSTMEVRNNRIEKAYMGVYANGGTTTPNGSGLTYARNEINSSGTNAVAYCGLYMQGVTGGLVANNDIGNFDAATSENDRGIWLATGATNVTVNANRIHDLGYTGSSGYGAKGVVVSTGAAAANVTISNNMISNMTGDGDSYSSYGCVYAPTGIYAFGSTVQGGLAIYDNSVFLYGNSINYAATAYSVGIGLDDNSAGDVSGNCVVNNLGRLSTIGAGAVALALETGASQLTGGDHNDLYANSTGGGANLVGKIGATDYATLAAWQAASGRDANSISADPLYVGGSDLHINTTGATSPVANAGLVLAGITDDYDGDVRTATPDIGADEFTTFLLATGVVGGGSITKVPSYLSYNPGSQVLLTAVPDSGWVFEQWTGDLTGSVNPDTLTMDSDKSVVAHFDNRPTISIADASAMEGTRNVAAFIVTLTAAYADTIKVDFATADSTALAGSDYFAAVGQLVFNPGVTSGTVEVTIIPDSLFEPDEYFRVQLSNVTNAHLGDALAIGTILNDDVPSAAPELIPAVTFLGGVNPNPSAQGAMVRYGLHRDGIVKLSIFDVQGRLMRNLVSGRQPAGYQRVVWDGRDAGGNRVGAGLYLLRMEADQKVYKGRMVVVR